MTARRTLLSTTALTRLGAFSAGLALLAQSAAALPQQGQVVGGSATIAQTAPNTLTVQQNSGNAVIDWKSFSIGTGETTVFNQPNSGSIAFNRVTGVDASLIQGNLRANGTVVLVNPNGMLFDKSAQVNVGGLVASTSSIGTANAMNGRLTFDRPSTSANATVVNRGTITAAQGGLVALVAPGVANSGVITAKLGKVSLASGNKWTLDLYGDHLVNFVAGDQVTQQVSGPDNTGTGVSHTGTIMAEAGTVELTANVAKGVVSNAINMGGVIDAGSVTRQGGTIVLNAGQSGVSVWGTLNVSGTSGGKVSITGDTVTHQGTIHADGSAGSGGQVTVTAASGYVDTEGAVTTANGHARGGQVTVNGGFSFYGAGHYSASSSAGAGGSVSITGKAMNLIDGQVDTSGYTDGGTISLGGSGVKGSGDLPHAETVTVSAGSVLDADAGQQGKGGEVEVWSDQATAFAGQALVRGGAEAGDGGTAEVSSAGTVTFAGLADAGSAHGVAGQLLLDPRTIVVDAVTGTLPQFDLVNPNPGAGGTFGSVSVVLSSGNLVITDPTATLGLGPVAAGAAYLFNGMTGQLISVLNGSHLDDNVGESVTLLTNGNYVVGSPNWNGGIGAATWGSGTLGVSGAVSASNSLTGSTIGDHVGLNVTALANGNYVVGSPDWNGTRGAATWANGATGLSGVVTLSNSLTGSSIGDQVGTSITALTSGNYVVGSPNWNGNKGAASWGNGATGLTGTISAANSLVGSTGGDLLQQILSGLLTGIIGDQVGLNITALSNGNYVVGSPEWNDGMGAATWGNGSTGLTGTVGISNSLTGTTGSSLLLNPITHLVLGGEGDQVGASVTALVNGNYVVGSPGWNGQEGAATWANGSLGLTGTVSVSNSLTGTHAGDEVGLGVTALANGNYVVNSPNWNGDIGAVTFAGGGVGLTATVGIGNSLVGSTANDQVGLSVTALTNGNYVVSSPDWNGTRGASTWASGTLGLTGTVTISNSLTGGTAGDEVGLSATALADGNYIVGSPDCNGDKGAATWGNGALGLTGAISAANSLVGSLAGDKVGSSVEALEAGAYVIGSAYFDGGYGAATYGQAGVALNGTINAQNSIIGTVVQTIPLLNLGRLTGGLGYLVSFATAGTGEVVQALYNPQGLTYGDNPGATVTITPSFLTQTLDTGTSVTLQANDDIVVNSAIVETSGGSLTLQAGRSLLLNAPIVTDNGNLTLIANDTAADGVVDSDRDAGAAQIDMGLLSSINAGTGTVSIHMANGAGITNASGGNIALNTINAGAISVVDDNQQTTTLNGVLTASGAGNSLVLSTGQILNNAGAGALVASAGRYLTYTLNPGNDVWDGITGYNKHYGISYALEGPAQVSASGDWMFYSVTPTLVLSAGSASMLYGGTVPTLGFSDSGLIDGDTVAAALGSTPVVTTSATAQSGVGSYATSFAGTLTSSLGYNIVLQNGALQVDPASLTIAANSQSRLYGNANAVLTATYTGLENGDSSSVVTGLTLATAATQLSNVGSYALTGSGASASNYTITYQQGAISITPAPLTITAGNETRVYGATGPALQATYSGLRNADTSAVVSGLTLSTAETGNSGVGSYAITASGAAAQNYAITYAAGQYQVTPASLTIAANSATRVYGDANPALGATYTGLVNGDASTAVTGLSLSTAATQLSNVGSYAITASGATAANYTIIYQQGAISITPAPLTITADNETRVYGAAGPALQVTYSGLRNSDTSAVVSGLTLSTAETGTSGVGSYSITASGAAAQNYAITYGVTGEYEVTPASLTIAANGATRLYGSANPMLGATYTGLVNGDGSSAVTGLTVATTATQLSNVGSYALTGSGATAANYTITYQQGAISITPAPLTITADNETRVYGAAGPALQATYSGLRNADTSAVVSGLTLATSETSTSGVGSYVITASGATAQNYTISYGASGEYQVTPASLTITADSASRSYGGTNPALGATYSGLVNGDGSNVVTGLNLSTTATSASHVGQYAITATDASAANYSVTYVSGTMAITPVSLVVTANDATRVYGAADPAFTATYSGFVNGDTTASLTGAGFSTAPATAGVGVYQLTPFASDADYAMTYVPGHLTITPAPLIITPNAITTTEGAAPVFTASFQGLVNGNTSSVITGLTFSSMASSASTPGTYQVTAQGGVDPNYTISYGPAAPVTVIVPPPPAAPQPAPQPVSEPTPVPVQRRFTVLKEQTDSPADTTSQVTVVDSGTSLPQNAMPVAVADPQPGFSGFIMYQIPGDQTLFAMPVPSTIQPSDVSGSIVRPIAVPSSEIGLVTFAMGLLQAMSVADTGGTGEVCLKPATEDGESADSDENISCQAPLAFNGV